MTNLLQSLLGIALVLSAISLPAQDMPDGQRREEIEAQKIAWLTRAMDLSPSEAQQFWPLYNEMEKEHMQLQESQLKNIQQLRDAESLSDQAIEALLQEQFNLRGRELALEERYLKSFSEALPMQKVAAYYEAERSFKRELLRQLRARMDARRGRP